MFLKCRWYRIHLPKTKVDLAEVCLSYPMKRDTDFGFTYLQDSRDELKFRFLWRMQIAVTILDENDLPAIEQIESIRYTDFAIVRTGNAVFLRVENPGRSTRELMNALETLVGFGFSCKPLSFENTKPVEVFKQVESTKLIGLKIVGAVVEEDLVARMEFASKRGMNIEKMRILESVKYKVDYAVFEIFYSGVRGQVAFSAGGLVKISEQLAPLVIHLLERDLAELA